MKLAIFDIDGTLTDSHGYDVHFFAALARAVGVDAVDGALDSWTHVTDEAIAYDVFAAHGRAATSDDVAQVKARYEAALHVHMTEVPPMPGAQAMLDALLGDDEWRLAIATGNWTRAGELKLHAGGIRTNGIPVVGCDERPSRAELMEHALALSNATHGAFEHVVYVGDAAWDVRACRELGWNFVGLNADPDRLLDLGATHVLADYLDLDAAHAALDTASAPR